MTPTEIQIGGEQILKQRGDDLSRVKWKRLTYLNHDRLHHLTHTHDAFCGQRIGKTKGEI